MWSISSSSLYIKHLTLYARAVTELKLFVYFLRNKFVIKTVVAVFKLGHIWPTIVYYSDRFSRFGKLNTKKVNRAKWNSVELMLMVMLVQHVPTKLPFSSCSEEAEMFFKCERNLLTLLPKFQTSQLLNNTRVLQVNQTKQKPTRNTGTTAVLTASPSY